MQFIRQLFLSLSVFFLIVTYSLDAISQDMLQLTSIEFESCQGGGEVCGNGLDENCDGIDTLCPGNDKDRDGFPASQDCDDTNRFVYPGISVGCEASCGKGYKTCQANGSFSSCVCTPLCESSTGTCYYADSVFGTVSGSGSFSNRMKSIDSLVKGSTLQGGDVVYLFSGLYGYDSGAQVQNTMLNISGLQATPSNMITFKNYPGEIPILKSNSFKSGVRVYGCRGILFEGLIIDGAVHNGFLISGSRDIVIKNSVIRGTYAINSTSASLVVSNSSGVTFDNTVVHGIRNLSNFMSVPAHVKSVGSGGVYFIKSAAYP